ncbi:peptidoglycan-binding protein [Silvibacterium dinghuense]|uniref:Peptidoglycan-binding protein n=2 Tax=Silvibacterium dinghuense TaxID=1560006 RepID=A0A4Q1SEK6_9BACT|nr:peptidoglycan-binding protein [Silvibacterium dinghuense]
MTALAVTPAVASRAHRAPTSGHHKTSSKKAKHVAVHHVIQGQRGIDSDRAREIQTALIRENYLTGTPSGQWDADTQAAMIRYQSDHGWQTKLTPDSRALIKLGLGPNQPADSATAKADTTALPQRSAYAANSLAETHSIQN